MIKLSIIVNTSKKIISAGVHNESVDPTTEEFTFLKTIKTQALDALLKRIEADDLAKPDLIVAVRAGN